MNTYQVVQLVDSGYRLPPPPSCPRVIYELIMYCWSVRSKPGEYYKHKNKEETTFPQAPRVIWSTGIQWCAVYSQLELEHSGAEWGGYIGCSWVHWHPGSDTGCRPGGSTSPVLWPAAHVHYIYRESYLMTVHILIYVTGPTTTCYSSTT